MGSSNTFSKALKHMKGHKPSRLHEEVPTNNTQGLYRVEPNILVMSHPGVDDPDFSQDGDGSSGYDGKDTSGLFMPDGTIRVAEPPGDTTAILGPMASMWYAWGNFSTFGYIRQSDRKMVNLGRITGKLSDWDGVSNFTSYNTGFTIDQAVWFRDVEKYGGISNDPAEANYRAFYPGPPSNTPDQYGRYYCTTTGVPKNRPTNTPPPNVPPDQAGYPWGPESNPENKPKKKKKGEPGEPELTPEGEEKLENGEPLGIDDFKSAADFSAFANGGGNAAMNQKGQTPGEVMQQGRENIGDYDSGPRNPTPIFPDGNLPNNTPTPRKGQGGRELGDTTQRGGDTTQRGGDTRNNTPTPDAPPRKGQGGRELGDTTKRAGENQSQKQPMDRVPYNGGLENPNLLGRLFRSVTDGVRYASDKILKGLPGAIEYNKDWKGGGKKLVDKLFGGSENAERILGSDWYKTDYGTPTSTLRRGEINVSRMYQSTDELTRGTPFGPKDGNYWIGDAPTQGKRGIKNPFGSQVSRGWTGTPEVQFSTKGGGLPMTKASADDIARLATAGSKTANTLSRLVPIVSFSAGAADVAMRIKNNDIPGAVMGGISMIPGPAGYIGLGIQQIYDLERAGGTPRDPNQSDAGTSSPTSGLSGFERESGKPQPDAYGGSGGGGLNFSRSQFDARQSAMLDAKLNSARKSNRVSEAVEPKNNDKTKLIKYLKSQDKDQLIRELIVALMSTGVPASIIKLVAKCAYGKKLTPDEEKFVKIALPKITKVLEQRRNSSNKKTRTESYKPLPRLPKRTNKDSSVNESHTLDVIRNIKKPVVIEEKKEKVKRRPRVIGSEPRTINSGMMKQAEVPASFKKPEDRMWGKYEQQQNARASQDRKNVVLDYLGNADQAWEYLLDRNAGKRSFAGYFEKDGTPRTIFTDGKVKTVTREEKVGSDTLIFFTDEEGKKGSILQSEYNDMQDQAHTQQMFAEYEATVAAEEENSFDVIAHKLELKAEKNPTNDKIQSMLSSYRALSHLKKEDKKQEAHFVSWKSSIDGTIANNFQSWVDSVGQETADAVTKVALAEKMSSANLFGATLPATGDYDHIDMTFDSTYLDPDNDDIVNGVGSGSGYKGGFPVADGEQDVIQLTGHGEYSASAYTTDQDLTYVDTLSVTAIAGNGSNGGLTPINGLDVYFIGDEDFAGPFNVAPASQSSYANSQITIPENMRTKNVSIYLYSNTSEYVNGMNFSGRHFGNQTFNVPGLDFTTIRNLFAYDDPGEENGEDFLTFYFTKRDRNNTSHMKSLGHYYWYNVQAQRLGLVDTNRTGSEGGWWWAQWPSPPVNPSKTFGDSGNNYVGGPEDEDYIKIGEMIWDQFFGTKLWGISNISFKRKAPASVYVPLDSPEAVNFMRTAPEMQGLTPAQRLKKLKEMLAAGNEYLIKMLGVSGSTATPGPNEPADYLDGADELLNDVSPEEQAEIEKNLAKLGPEYAEIAAIPAALPLLASPAGQAALAAGAAAVGTLLIQAGINVSGTDWGAAPGRNTVGDLPGRGGTAGGRELTPDQQAEVEAAGNELRDARRALEDLPDDATQAERDMAQERLDRASKNRQRVRKKHKEENKNRKESYEVKSSGKKYLSDSKTFKKQSFSKWYGSMESDTADKVISDAKIETKDQVLELVFDEFNRLRLQEGMTSKGFEYIYGLAVSNIVSQYGIDSKFASDLLHASADTTDYEFGPSFPGSYVNSIGDYEVDSSRKINVNAYYDSKFGSVSGSGGNFTLRTVDGPSGASVSQLNSALGITLPNGIAGALGGSPEEGSAVQRIFTGAQPGNIINFNWGFSSSEKGLPQDTKVDDYAFVAITGRVTKFVSILQGGDTRGGSFRYRLKPGDIDGNGNVKVAIGVVDVYDDIYNTTLRVNSFGSLYAGDIGSIGDTTDAADLGAPVNNLDPKKKKRPQQQQPSYMNIQVGDQQIVKVNNRTVTDTSRGIRDGQMDGRPTYYDNQGNMRVSQPRPQPKPQSNRTKTSNNTSSNRTNRSSNNRTSITNVPRTTQFTPEPMDGGSVNPNLAARGLRSATDQMRYGGNKMFQGNPAGRAPGLSNYWSPDPATAGTYSNPGAGKGVPGARPNPTGTLTTAPRPANTPRVTRSPLGQPQFKFPAGSPPPANMITQMADDAAVSAGRKAAARTAGKTLGRVVPFVSVGVAVADAGIRASKGDYAGAVLSGVSAIPGPIGWAGLGVQIATDAAGVTGVREQKEFTDYSDYLKNAGELAKKNNVELDRNAMLDSFLRQIAKSKQLSNNDKSFLVAIFTDAEGLEKDDVVDFVKSIQKKLSSKN